MPAQKSSSFIDSFLETLTAHPSHLLGVVLLVLGCTISLIGVLLSILICFVSRYNHLPAGWFVASGVGLLLLCFGVDHLSLGAMVASNGLLWHELWRGSWEGLMPFVFLTGIPMSLILGGCWQWLLQWKRLGLAQEVRRVSQGQLIKAQLLSTVKLKKAFKKLKTFQPGDATVLGVDRDTGAPVVLTDADANLHTLVVGTTGSGKTTALINLIESAIARRWPLFYIDGKGDIELAKRIQAFAEERQVSCQVFSMLGESVHYNPISVGGYTSKKDRIVALRHWSEEHYKKIAEGYLQTVFKLLEDSPLPLDLYTLSHYLKPESLYVLAREYQRTDWVPLIEQLEDQLPHVQSLISEIENLAQSEIGPLFQSKSGEVMTLSEVLEHNAVGYFCLQPLCFPAYAETLGKLIINDLKSLMAMQLQQAHKKKIMVILDEFSVFAGEQVINLINQGRSAGVHAVLATQSLADIQKKGGDALLGQVLNNSNNYIIMRQNNPSDAEILANIIGTQDNFEVTSQLSQDQGSTGMGSVRQTKAFLVHPDEIKRLGVGEAIYLNKRAFQCSRTRIIEKVMGS